MALEEEEKMIKEAAARAASVLSWDGEQLHRGSFDNVSVLACLGWGGGRGVLWQSRAVAVGFLIYFVFLAGCGSLYVLDGVALAKAGSGGIVGTHAQWLGFF